MNSMEEIETLAERVRAHCAGETQFDDKTDPFDLDAIIVGGYRCALAICPWMTDWFVGTSPRNGDNAAVEGSWSDWVSIARDIIAVEELLIARSSLNPETDVEAGPTMSGQGVRR